MDKIKNYFKVLFDGEVVKPLWKYRAIFLGVGILAGLLTSLITKHPAMIFFIVFLIDFVIFLIRANIKNIKFNYCYFAMVFAGCGIYLMIF